MLRYMGVGAVTVDFDADNLKGKPLYEFLGEWVCSYFNAFPLSQTAEGASKITLAPPLYLQYDGHSITIIGYEIRNGNLSLLVFDPSNESNVMQRTITNQVDWQKYVKRGITKFSKKQYQIVYALPLRPNSLLVAEGGALSKLIVGQCPLEADLTIFAASPT